MLFQTFDEHPERHEFLECFDFGDNSFTSKPQAPNSGVLTVFAGVLLVTAAC